MKTYVLTVYALSGMLEIKQPTSEVTREILLDAMKDKILERASLSVTYDRPTSAP